MGERIDTIHKKVADCQLLRLIQATKTITEVTHVWVINKNKGKTRIED